MARPRIDELLRLMRQGFEGGQFSLLTCLGTVSRDAWTQLPVGGERPIRTLVHHVGLFKFMYANHAFRGGNFDYDDPPATPGPERLATPEHATDWLRDGHRYLTSAIEELADDSELAVLRKAHWGQMVPTETLITIVLQHDLFHAGEINHARAILQGDDRWDYPVRDP